VNLLIIQRSTSKLWQTDGSTTKGLAEDSDIGTSIHRIGQSTGVYSILYIACIRWETRIRLQHSQIVRLTTCIPADASGSRDC
jgi:hypothetical protein